MLKVADSINHAHKQTTGVCVVLENVAGGVSHHPPCNPLQYWTLAVYVYLSTIHSLTPAGLQLLSQGGCAGHLYRNQMSMCC